MRTFEALNLGTIFDFDFKLPHANKRWVNLWVEKYESGNKASQPLVQLSYGNSPKEVEESHLGFGMINLNSEDFSVFLYGPGVSVQEPITEKESKTNVFIGNGTYGIDEEGLKRTVQDLINFNEGYHEEINSVNIGKNPREALKVIEDVLSNKEHMGDNYINK